MDKLTPEKRSWNMSRIKSKNTTPELIIRSILHRNGLRFRLHAKNLPGKPDIVLPKYKTVIEVRGCFWHQHQDCREGKIPKTRYEWWKEKLLANQERDQRHTQELLRLNWNVLIIWQCFLKWSKSEDSIKNTVMTAIKKLSLKIEPPKVCEINTYGNLVMQRSLKQRKNIQTDKIP